MHWKLRTSANKYCLKHTSPKAGHGKKAHHPAPAAAAASHVQQQQHQQGMALAPDGSGVSVAMLQGDMELVAESAAVRPPDPSLGRLSVETDRVALATMAAILPYDGD